MLSTRTFREHVFDTHGRECIICDRSPEDGYEHSDQDLSVHHVNGDSTDNRPENGIPVCQSCHVHIHRADHPPYRQWHRQLPIEHRHPWNQFTPLPYTGPQLTRTEAERRFGDDNATPRSLKYQD
ncbi:HNH endonuclease [Halobacterium salinarum]|uniref:Putative HNH-type endonuclease n=1 Tax=Halobacterium salinarum (strain ATCC 33171 / DSM 3754 / JCM 8978 / NBRC 102687 / NCIMB 764 / 91-R6) TaxID=2597657 RepID=A0A4D6GT97_HALS9|nr:HNH endonuclease [Halobacterium salinarum]MDL0121711.1 HNH endonuclease [Halobacterium salinarum]MDL0134726.1 HNH endonuclease [Halobacterium salinarum]QCC44913.1 putative HNH-type endonuclease [Halobacterium salinarum]TYO73675.1 hypothetical protein APQ99_02384 [Halobacterium salinarum DSM 3754]